MIEGKVPRCDAEFKKFKVDSSLLSLARVATEKGLFDARGEKLIKMIILRKAALDVSN